MEAVIVMARVDRLRQLGLDFDRKLVSGQHVEPGAVVALAQREHRRQHGRGGVGKQSVDAVLGDRELRVVVIVGVHRDPVGERGETRGHFHISADHGAAFVGRKAERPEIGAHDMPRFGGVAGERQPEAVEDGTLAQVHDIGRNAGGLWCR